MPSQYLEYNCCPLVDGCRTFAYMNHLNHPMSPNACQPGTGFSGGCGCCITPGDEDHYIPEGGFVSPVSDPAPWYSASDPRSGHYLGALLIGWEESQPYSREIADTGFGGKPKSSRLGQKEIVARFLLAVNDCCAIPFARAYFVEQLTCVGGASSCDAPSLEWHECFTPGDCNSYDNAFRGMPLTSVTNISFLEDEIECCLGIIAEVTFASELPYIYEMCSDKIISDYPIVAGDPLCNFCGPDCPPVIEPCANPCVRDIIEPREENIDGCYCEPFEAYQNCFKVESSRRIGHDTLKIIIKAGSSPLSSLRLKAWPNPIGVEDSSVFACVEPCIDIAIPGPLPALSELEIDGMTRRSILSCGGGIQNGRRWIESGDGSPFSWPDVGCEGLMVCLTSDAAVVNGVPNTAPDATISIERFHRELR